MPSLPTVGGSTGTWGTDLNEFLQVAHNADGTLISAGGGYASAQLVRYVDYINGDDANAGLSPTSAFQTIQAAYDDLVTVALATYTEGVGGDIGVGTLILLPGDHDVGTGVTLDRLYPVDILGSRAGWNAYLTKDSGSRIYSSSAAATELIQIGDPAVGGLAGSIVGVTFVADPLGVNSALVSCIHSDNVVYLHVERCAFTTPDGTGASIQVAAIDMETDTLDHSWMRILNNRSSRLCFLRMTGSPFFRCVIDSNVVFYDGPLAALQIDGHMHGCTISNNNLEGSCVGVQLNTNSDADKNVFINNHGESAGGAQVFYDFVGSVQHCMIIGGNCTATAANGTWVQFSAASHSNTIIGQADLTGVTGWKQKIVDNSTLGNYYMNPNAPRHRVKSGAGVATIADGDFSFGTPMDGQIAVTHNTSDGVSRLAVKVNGAWKYVVVA